MRIPALIIISLQFVSSFVFSQSVSYKAQTVKESWYSPDSKSWGPEVFIKKYKYNSSGDTLEALIDDRQSMIIYKWERTINKLHQPVTEKMFVYYTQRDTWIFHEQKDYLYKDGLLIFKQHLAYDISFNVTKTKVFYSYDTKGRIAEYYKLDSIDEQWIKTYGIVHAYADSAGFLKTHTTTVYNPDQDKHVNDKKTEFTYDTKGNIIKKLVLAWQIDYNDMVYKWLGYNVDEYKYNATGVYTEHLFGQGMWPYQKYTDIQWYDWDKKQKASYIYHIWNTDKKQWDKKLRYKISYPDSVTSVTLIEELYDNFWILKFRETLVVRNGKKDVIKSEILDANDKWKVHNYILFEHTYDTSMNLRETIYSLQDHIQTELTPMYRYVYEDYVQIVGMDQARHFISADIYPNPANKFINITINAKKAIQSNIVIYDLAGRRMSCTAKTISPGKNTFEIEINNLEPGIYIIKIESAGGNVYSGKIVKTQ